MSVKVRVFLYVFYVFGAALSMTYLVTWVHLLFYVEAIWQFVICFVLLFMSLFAFIAFIARVFDLEKN